MQHSNATLIRIGNKPDNGAIDHIKRTQGNLGLWGRMRRQTVNSPEIRLHPVVVFCHVRTFVSLFNLLIKSRCHKLLNYIILAPLTNGMAHNSYYVNLDA
jgi:hypothetical protein